MSTKKPTRRNDVSSAEENAAEKETSVSSRVANRPKRRPVDGRNQLTAPEIPGFKTRYVNEVAGRVENFLAADWTIVTHDELAKLGHVMDYRVQDGKGVGSPVRVVVNQGLNASSQTAVLMKLPVELFEEGFAIKQEAVDRVEESYNPEFQSGEGFYGKMNKRYK